MDLSEILVLGIVQGITEWIPVSSKTQVTFVYLKLFHGDPALVIPILLSVHLGTVIAACLYFRSEIRIIARELVSNPLDIQRHANGRIGFLFVALLCTGIVGIPLLVAEKNLFSALDAGLLYAIMGTGLIVTGLLLLTHKRSNVRKTASVSWKDGIATGILQGLSVLPGVSRSGTSTTGLLWQGFDSESSFYLSFLLSIPTVVLAEIVLSYWGTGMSSLPAIDGIILLLTSLIVGYLTIDGLLKVIQRVNVAYVVLFLGALIMVVGLSGLG